MSTLLKKACSLVCHELGHALGLEHCIYFRCIMNGVNAIEEDNKVLLYLCPVCLNKLYFLLNFNIYTRYLKLFDWFKRQNFNEELEWYLNGRKNINEIYNLLRDKLKFIDIIR